MAGHSKWANIKHRKGRQDALRGKKNTKLIREVTVAVREGGADPKSNSRLRLAIAKAYAENVTKDSINRAIDKGLGQNDSSTYTEVMYEGYGPAGVAMLVLCLSDNKNRTVAEVRHAFNKYGGNLGTDGSVSYLFDRRGLLVCDGVGDFDAFMNDMLAVAVDDIDMPESEVAVVDMAPGLLSEALAVCEAQQYHVLQSDIVWQAQVELELNAQQREKLQTLVDVLEDLDDVQSVFTNVKDCG